MNVKNCSCSHSDYECDYCYIRTSDNSCVLDEACAGFDPRLEPYPCYITWEETRGYRKVPGDSCDPTAGTDLRPRIHNCSQNHPIVRPPSTRLPDDSAGFGAGLLTAVIVVFAVFLTLGGLYALSGRSPAVRNVVTTCFPERFLPELVVPRVNYGIMASSIDDDEDLHRDAKVIDLADSDEEPDVKKSNDDFDPRSSSTKAPGTNIGNLI